MIKYIHSDKIEDSNKHWQYCMKNFIPHIVVSQNDNSYSNISYDLLPCLQELYYLNGDVSDNILKMYDSYIDFFQIPENKLNACGGQANLGFDVKTEHTDFISEKLFDYLCDYVKNNRELKY